MCEEFEKRHDFIVGALNEIDGIHCMQGDGTFYCFPNIEGLIEKTENVSDDVGFVEYLLNQAGVATVPGTAFGSPRVHAYLFCNQHGSSGRSGCRA